MPIREYTCPNCGFKTERLEYTQQAGSTCPRCETEHNTLIEMVRELAAPAVHFSGSGWTRPKGWTGKPERGQGPNGAS